MTDQSRPWPETPAARTIRDWLAVRHPGRPPAPDSDLRRDLGIDSIGWLDLALAVEQHTGVGLPDPAIARIRTVGDLLRHVAEAEGSRPRAAAPSIMDAPDAHLDDRQRRWLEPLGRSERRLARGLHRVDRMVMHTVFRLRAEGLDRLPDGPAVLAPTHGSLLDPPALAATLDHARLQRTFWGETARILFANPPSRWVGRLAQAVPIDPEHYVIASFALPAAVLRRGYSLIWFPEGRLSRSGGIETFRPGIGVLLARFRVPVVPVAIHGTREAWPVGQRLPRPHPVLVTFGDALDPGDLDREGEGTRTRDRITDALRRQVTALFRRTAPDRSGRRPG